MNNTMNTEMIQYVGVNLTSMAISCACTQSSCPKPTSQTSPPGRVWASSMPETSFARLWAFQVCFRRSQQGSEVHVLGDGCGRRSRWSYSKSWASTSAALKGKWTSQQGPCSCPNKLQEQGGRSTCSTCCWNSCIDNSVSINNIYL